MFVLFTGIGWEDLPQELGFGSGMTCWRRLRDWQERGVFDRLHHAHLVTTKGDSHRLAEALAGKGVVPLT
ncbi:hypothetical protein KALB_5277 [Kutzneria albida DSM 43870]|uniref:Insertion element IS402-like domain-containing protein n=1 Tax=Kutzneria albida DSM 43870 TaxID=1449976 RepID=W5WKG0_9PSEU|nr:hypothetical protein KALB_5277 [Kutzneria albida DSM 43870]